MIYYGCGLAVAAMITVAAGTRFVEQRGWPGFLIVAALTVVLGLIIGWGLDGYVTFIAQTRRY